MRAPSIRDCPETQSQLLLEVLSEHDEFLIVMHDDPDPDASASGWAIHELIQETLSRPVRLSVCGDARRKGSDWWPNARSSLIFVRDEPSFDRLAVSCGLQNYQLWRESS